MNRPSIFGENPPAGLSADEEAAFGDLVKDTMPDHYRPPTLVGQVRISGGRYLNLYAQTDLTYEVK
jgi:hypothetical protein